MRYVNSGNEGIMCAETENIVAEFPAGRLFGEIALLDETKATRVLSAMTKTDCIMLLLNKEAFDLMVKDKIKKEQEEIGKFVYSSIPTLSDNFTLFTVIHNAHLLFKETVKYEY